MGQAAGVMGEITPVAAMNFSLLEPERKVLPSSFSGLTRQSSATCGAAPLRMEPSPLPALDSGVRPEDLRPAGEIRADLGLDPDRPAVLMQLGAGQVNDVGSLSAGVVVALRRHPEVQIVVTESVLTRTPAALPEDVHRLRHFPISEYRNAFDAS